MKRFIFTAEIVTIFKRHSATQRYCEVSQDKSEGDHSPTITLPDTCITPFLIIMGIFFCLQFFYKLVCTGDQQLNYSTDLSNIINDEQF